jgi:hypothetical protein
MQMYNIFNHGPRQHRKKNHVAHLFSFLCFVFSLCFVYPMLPVSLDCQFLIAPSVFCNAYLSEKEWHWGWSVVGYFDYRKY